MAIDDPVFAAGPAPVPQFQVRRLALVANAVSR
ncbi:hypothetical protein BJY21_003091 [Kineosphaera limosa]|nr:hypothetical protein [Kineosphaera limosa]